MSSIARLVVRSTSILAVALCALIFTQHNLPETTESPQTGTASKANLELSSRKIEFADTAAGESEAALLTLTNDHAQDSITVTSLFLDEADSKYFALSHQAPLTLAPGQSLSITIGFEPDSEGVASGTLFISHTGNGGVDNVDLYGVARSELEPPIAAATPASFSFGKTTLQGFTGSKPTSLQFGPDGRLYVATMLGEIHILTVDRTGKNQYKVAGKETIHSIKNIPNHDDDGDFNASVKNRLVTGLAVTGTPAQPVIYVHSSDPRIGGGPSGNITGLDTNSGILSRLTKNGNGWSKLDLVRGLPRSDENHHSNGIALKGNKLYLAAGGNTNMGAPSNNFGGLPEFALSAAILEIDLDAIGNSTYDLPTLNDEDRQGTNDHNDPFGGNRGKNQAKLIPGGPVQVYSPGWRNPYDVVIMQNGFMYSWDNGPNSGWGAAPGNCSNNYSEPGSTQHDALHQITGQGYYAGHPNPTRADTKNKFNNSNPQSPVSTKNLIECNYYGPGVNGNGHHPQNKSLISLPRSTNGLAEYSASNFNGQMNGNLLATSWDNKVYRVAFNASGDVDQFGALFSNVGTSPLDVTALSDADPFPGTIWVADFQGNDIVVYEPGDYQGTNAQVCVAGFGNGDADNDGFSDADELANQSNPCSQADIPADADDDQISDLIDPDDDNDGLADKIDPFALDPYNGATTQLDVDYQWENGSEGAGFIADLGFSGLMTNGVDDYQSLYDLNGMTIIGAAGVVTIDEVPAGDPYGQKNTQQFGFQFGVNVSPLSDVFRIHTRIVNPFVGLQPGKHQSMGVYLGNGDQDNYTKLTVTSDGFQYLSEVNGEVQFQQNVIEPITNKDYIDLIIEVDPASAIATGYFQITGNGVSQPEQQIASNTFPPEWLSANTKLAIGIISTSFAAQPFPATWDFLTVKKLQSDQPGNAAPSVSINPLPSASVNVPVGISATIVDQESATADLTVQWSVEEPSGTVSFSDDESLSPTVIFSAAGTYTLKLTVSDGEQTSVDYLPVNVLAPVVQNNVLYRLNVGGGSIQAGGEPWVSDEPFASSGKTWSSSAAVDVSDVNDVPAALFNTERYAPPANEKIQWDLPVIPGTYEVRLYFSEIFFGAMAPGVRVFDLDIEGTEMTDIDPYAIAGGNKGFARILTVNSDSTLNIILKRNKQNPALKGIEVLGAGGTGGPGGTASPVNIAPVVSIGGANSINAGESIALTGTVTDDGLPDGDLSYQWSVAGDDTGVTIGSPDSQSTSLSFNDAGVYKVTLNADDGELTGSSSHTIQVLSATVNAAPLVSAGDDVQVLIGETLQLNGLIQDDGLPDGSVSALWSVQSGGDGAVISQVSSSATQVTFNTPGVYVLRLTGTDTQFTTFDELTVVVVDDTPDNPTTSEVIYRVNAGGPEISHNDQVWAADTGSLVSGGNIFSSGAKIDTSVLPAIPMAVFQTERWSKQSMNWDFPVMAGNYVVNLYFAEIYSGAMANGARQFNVEIEGLEQAPVDVFSEVGATAGLVKTYQVQSDSLLNVSLLPLVQNPAIKGIEIIAVQATPVQDDGGNVALNSAPVVDAGNEQLKVFGESIVLSGEATDDGLPAGEVSVVWQQISGPVTLSIDNPDQLSTGITYTQAGTYGFQLSATDGELTSSDSVTVVISDAQTSEIVYRINTGGPLVTDPTGDWLADSVSSSYVTTGKFWSNPVAIDTTNVDPVPDKLFTSERFDPAAGADMEWSLPATNGNYRINLYFAEIWPGAYATGKRQFAVSLENQVDDVIDVYGQAGANKAMVKSYDVQVTDGNLSIGFTHNVENPSIKAIEVVSIN